MEKEEKKMERNGGTMKGTKKTKNKRGIEENKT